MAADLLHEQRQRVGGALGEVHVVVRRCGRRRCARSRHARRTLAPRAAPPSACVSSSLRSCSLATSLSSESSTQLGVRAWPRATSSSARSVSASAAPGEAGSSDMRRSYPYIDTATNVTLAIAFGNVRARTADQPPDRGRPLGARDRRREGVARRLRRFCRGGRRPTTSARPSRACPAPPAARQLAIVGHIDEIGLHVSHIDDEGYLHFGEVGGWDASCSSDSGCALDTRNGPVTGVIGRKPIHLIKDEERKKVPSSRTCTSTSAPRTATRRAGSSASATLR